MNNITSENTSFNYLRGSSDFLNLLINSISSCVLLLNKDMQLIAFNNALKTVFSNKRDEHLLYKKCGEAIGCAYVIESDKECGMTQHCSSCELRKNATMTYVNGVTFHKHRITREFFSHEEEKVVRHLQYSTRLVNFHEDRYILLIVEDLTHMVEKDRLIEDQQKMIDELKRP